MRCCLCGGKADGRFGVRIADHRHIVCYPHAGIPSAEAAARLAERAMATAGLAAARGPAAVHKGRWCRGGERCSAGCKLASGHHGKCFNGDEL